MKRNVSGSPLICYLTYYLHNMPQNSAWANGGSTLHPLATSELRFKREEALWKVDNWPARLLRPTPSTFTGSSCTDHSFAYTHGSRKVEEVQPLQDCNNPGPTVMNRLHSLTDLDTYFLHSRVTWQSLHSDVYATGELMLNSAEWVKRMEGTLCEGGARTPITLLAQARSSACLKIMGELTSYTCANTIWCRVDIDYDLF